MKPLQDPRSFGGGDGWGLERAAARFAGRALGSGGGPVNLMGANPSLLPLAAVGSRMGLSVTSGFRPGSVTSSGNMSYHASGRALDLADGPSQMLAYARFVASAFGGRLKELIHTPLGFSIKDGRRVPPFAQADHLDHVHVAMARGGGVGGSGSGDKVPALLEPGEFVMNRKATARARPLLEAMNSRIPRFASGGLVARAAQAAGFRGANLLRAVAEAWGESGWNERAVGDSGNSLGLMQIYLPAHPWARGLNLFDPFVNMRAAKRIFDAAGSWAPWHANHVPGLARARAAIASIARKAKKVVKKTPRRKAAPKRPRHAFTGPGAREAFMGAFSDQLAMREALAALTPGVADDIAVARAAVTGWRAWLDLALKKKDQAAITTAAQNLKSAQDTLGGLLAPADAGGVAGPSESVALLQGLLREANQRTAVSQAQYGVFSSAMPRTGGGSAGASPVNVNVNVASGMDWLTRYIDTRVESASRRVGRRAPLPGRGGG